MPVFWSIAGAHETGTMGPMPQLIAGPSRIPVPGDKIIDEYAGAVNNGETQASIAHMRSPAGWSEPGQRPEFNEYMVVLKGMLRVRTEKETLDVKAGQAVLVKSGEWVQYSSPEPEGAEYIAVCLPAFSLGTVNRDKK